MFGHNHSPSTTMAICGGLSLVRTYRVRPRAPLDLESRHFPLTVREFSEGLTCIHERDIACGHWWTLSSSFVPMQIPAAIDFVGVDADEGWAMWYPACGVVAAGCFIMGGWKGVSTPQPCCVGWVLRRHRSPCSTHAAACLRPARGRKAVHHRRPRTRNTPDHRRWVHR